MAITINGSGTITGVSAGGLPDGCVTADDIGSLPSGSVLQVVQAQLGSYVDVSSTSVTNLFSASITPSSTSSKILILASINGRKYSGSNTSSYVGINRDSTRLPCSLEWIDASVDLYTSATITYLDSPSTTSSTTYYATAQNGSSSDTFRYFADGYDSVLRNCSIQLLEIAG